MNILNPLYTKGNRRSVEAQETFSSFVFQIFLLNFFVGSIMDDKRASCFIILLLTKEPSNLSCDP